MSDEPGHRRRYFDYVDSPIGLVEVRATESGLDQLIFVDKARPHAEATGVTERAVAQLVEYFAGTRRVFDLPLEMLGTPFQLEVWQMLLTVPYGETSSYQAIADALGRPNAVRAVGAANGRNPISIVVPCHRIIGSNGALVGYGGGLPRKEWLLRHEGALLI